MSQSSPNTYTQNTNTQDAHFYASRLAFIAGVALLTIIGYGGYQAVSQQTFELLFNLHDYQTLLLEQQGPLRVILGLDNLFIAFYAGAVIFLVKALRNNHNALELTVILCLVLAGAVLDYIENHHILAMIFSLNAEISIQANVIEAQMVASALKWHFGFFAFFLVGFVFKPETQIERVFRWALWYVQMPLGVFYYVSIETRGLGSMGGNSLLETVLFVIRYLNLVVGFFFFGYVFDQRWKRESGAKNLQPEIAH